MSNIMLLPDEKARIIWGRVWMEDLERLYGENAYGVVLEYLAGLKTACAVSPVHCHDLYTAQDVRDWCKRHIDPDTGEVRSDALGFQPRVGDAKKAHIHWIFEFKNPVTPRYLSKMLKDLIEIAPNRWERVLHPDSAKLYLCHKGFDDKYQYSPMEVHSFGSIKMGVLLRSDEMVKANSFVTVMQYIIDNNVRHYHVLSDWAFKTGDYEIISCVTGRASHFANYFRSKSDMYREEKEKASSQRK